MLEKEIEAYFRDQVRRRLGGKAFKFESPGNSGVPDRLVCLPGGRVLFVETKAPGKKLRPLQEARARELRALGFRVELVDSRAAADRLLESLEEGGDTP